MGAKTDRNWTNQDYAHSVREFLLSHRDSQGLIYADMFAIHHNRVHGHRHGLFEYNVGIY